ncbi:hypothetical protein KKB18_09255, partial [bacterium]|nr:hypothetical protein [bacterium]
TLYVKESGIYHVTYKYLKEAGIPVDDIDPTTIQLFNKNNEIPLYFNGKDDSSFSSGDYFDFYGVRNTEEGYYYSNWTDNNPYFLRWNIEKGKRIEEVSSLQSGGEYFSDFLFYEHFEENGVYDGMDYGTDGDDWMWESLYAGENITKEINIENPDQQTSEEAYIKIAFEGITSLDHHVVLYINGSNIGDLFWKGAGQYEYPTNKDDPPLYFPNNLLTDGLNSFTVELPGDTPAGEIDAVYLNWFEIHYYKPFDTKGMGELIFRGKSENKVLQEFKIMNVPDTSFDIYNIISGQKIIDYIIENNEIEFTIPASSKDWYYCITNYSKKLPVNIVKYNSTGLRSKENGVDYLIITTKEFVDCVKPLARWREEAGSRVKIACVSDIYTEFGYGLYNAESIRNFTRYAFGNWKQPALSYILLVGDASWDRKMRLKEPYSKIDYVPCYLDPARDDYYVYLTDGDEIPDACIGRFPAEDKSQVIRMVNKVIHYEGFPQMGEWWKNAIFINGEDNDEYYKMLVENFKERFPKGWNFIDIFKDITPETKPYNEMILDAFNEGGTFLTFQGHGAPHIWETEDFFKRDDAQKITNSMKLPLVLDLSCHTGRFAEPNMISLSEYFTTQSADLSGSIGFWGSSGVSVVDIDTKLTTKLFDYIFFDKIAIITIGKAILQSKLYILTSTASEDEWSIPTYIATHIFLGDPALRLAIPPNPTTVKNVQVKTEQDGEGIITWDLPEDPSISDYRIFLSSVESANIVDITPFISGSDGNSTFGTSNIPGKFVLFISSESDDGLNSHFSEFARFPANQEGSGSSMPFVYGGNVFYDGSILSFFASVKDNDDAFLYVELYYQGIKTGLKLAPYIGEKTESMSDNLYSLQIPVKGIPKGQYLFDLIAADVSGNTSDLYPYLTLHGWDDKFYLKDIAYEIQDSYPLDLACNEGSPVIIYAGYEDSFISTHFGGNLKITVLATDPDGISDVDKIKIYYNGFYTGIDVTQREDFEDYTRFGLNIPLDSGIINSVYLFQLVALDKSGNTSECWPYLRVD